MVFAVSVLPLLHQQFWFEVSERLGQMARQDMIELDQLLTFQMLITIHLNILSILWCTHFFN